MRSFQPLEDRHWDGTVPPRVMELRGRITAIEPFGFGRLFDALVDPARCERTMAVLLACYALTWSLYAAVAHSSQDTHFDMGEMFAWSHEAGLGTPTQPPLGAWLVRGWFAVMPVEPWSYYMFAVILATVALWIAWRVLGRYLTPEKRVVGLLLLTFLPFYNFHAFKFNANTVLIPLWAATTCWFLCSFETRLASWALLAGVGAAASMLGKYWSVFLLAGLALAALTDARRGAYFRSAAPWLTVASGAVALAPHIAWVMTHGFRPFAFALTTHEATLATAVISAPKFIVGILAYVAAPVILGILATHPREDGNRQHAVAARSRTPYPRCCVRSAASPRGPRGFALAGGHRLALVDVSDDTTSSGFAFTAPGNGHPQGCGPHAGACHRFSAGDGCCFACGRNRHSPRGLV